MACVIDWSALGTWVTGVAAAFIAWQAYRFAATAGRAQREADSARAHAYRLAVLTEFLAIRKRADAMWDHAETAIRTQQPGLVYGAMRMLAVNPSFATSPWVIESPSIGHVARDEANAIARAVAATAEAERFRAMIAGLGDLLESETPEAESGRLQMLSGARGGHRELADSIAVVESLLRPKIGPL